MIDYGVLEPLNQHYLISNWDVSVTGSGGSGEKCPLGVLITALLLPFAVTISRGGQDKRKAMFHLCCLCYFKFRGDREDGGSLLLQRRGEEEILTLPFFPPFFFTQNFLFAVVFKYGTVINVL